MAEPARDPFPRVFQPLRMRGRVLRARVYLPGHQPGLADGSVPGERYVDYHRQRARAGLGMQITGATPVTYSEVWAGGRCLLNIDDRIVPGYRALARAVHEEGGLMLAQLAHVGAMETAGDAILSASWEQSELTQRTDAFGGDRDGRTLFPRQVLAAVREAVGEDAIIGIRMPGDELVDGGIDAAEAAELARRLVATGTVD